MLMSLCTGAFATESMEKPEKYVTVHVYTPEETADFWREHNTSLYTYIKGTVQLRRNIDGTQGIGCGYFTAESDTIDFVITNAPGALTYNVYLADSHNNAVSSCRFENNINDPVGFRDLIIGEEYHFVVSSNDIPRACTANYEVY